MDLSKTTALITGANRGIGKALVKALVEADVKLVYAAARDKSKLAETIAYDPARVLPIELDVTKQDQIERAAKVASKTTLLINNAGALAMGNMLDVPMELVARDVETNYYGKLKMIRAFAPLIEKNGGGTIVNFLTLIAYASMPSFGAYCASKAAAWSMNQSLRATLRPKGIKLIGVFPGAIDTDMLAGVEMDKTPPSVLARKVVDGIAADAEDIQPDPMSESIYTAWKQDHKAVEAQFSVY
jgi:NAD(P)-dependent dehydrogenase (short-subunit alcohol dehydrogenase family)